jgi:hypothetical protein
MLTKRAEKAAKDYARKTPREDLCLAKVTSGDAVKPGPHNVLPVLCSMHKTQAGGIYLLLTSFLLRIADESNVGTLHWMLPWNERTETVVSTLLASFGWDGRVWPEESGWPGEGTQEAKGLKELLRGANLHATLTFPPDANDGNAVLRQDVLRTSADFPLSPEVEGGAKPASPEMIEKLRKLAEDPVAAFGQATWT